MTALAGEILKEVLRFRRHSDPRDACATSYCARCASPHLPKISQAIAQGVPITFVLPAFPGKSPNPAKVFGPLPDMAEQRALEFLQQLCDGIKRRYSPGAKIILCSDGRVFSDVVGMRDTDVTAYREELVKMIRALHLTSISTFNLEDLCAEMDFDCMRRHSMERYGESIEVLKASVNNGAKKLDASADEKEMHRLYCGITRFLLEDALFPGQTRSRTSLQKECRVRAYELIRRSQAWGELIEARFPEAVRLSIHPQSCGAGKLGIRLLDCAYSADHWQTPWHGVAVEVEGRFVLLKRAQAERLGARLVHHKGRPSHFLLPDEIAHSTLQGAARGI